MKNKITLNSRFSCFSLRYEFCNENITVRARREPDTKINPNCNEFWLISPLEISITYNNEKHWSLYSFALTEISGIIQDGQWKEFVLSREIKVKSRLIVVSRKIHSDSEWLNINYSFFLRCCCSFSYYKIITQYTTFLGKFDWLFKCDPNLKVTTVVMPRIQIVVRIKKLTFIN